MSCERDSDSCPLLGTMTGTASIDGLKSATTVGAYKKGLVNCMCDCSGIKHKCMEQVEIVLKGKRKNN